MMPIRLTPAVKIILISCVAIFVFGLFSPSVVGALALYPGLFASGWLWQAVTYGFVHSDPLYLVLNLLMLAFIGSELESMWGTKRFVQYYLFCLIVAGLFYVLLARTMGSSGPMFGSTGAIYGLLVAYGILFKERMMLFMMIFPMKAKHFIWILAGVEFLSSISHGGNRIISVAHLAGMGAGVLYLYGRATWNVFIKQRKDQWATAHRVKRVKGAKHLKLIKNEPKDHLKKDDPRTWH